MEGTLGIYIYRAFVVLLLYDHAITFYLEVERIWTLEWRLPKFLFLINRYIAPALVLSFNIATVAQPKIPTVNSLNSHQKHGRLYAYPYFWIRTLPLLTAELVHVIRVSALYSHNKTMLRCLTSFWACQGISVIAFSCVLERDFRNVSAIWIPYVIFDGIIVILTVYKVFSYRDHMGPAVRLLARDSVAYFIIMFGIFLFNVHRTTIQGIEILLPAECIASIAVARMMMNIRGLVFDDPYGSQGMKLPIIEFRVPEPPSAHSADGEVLGV